MKILNVQQGSPAWIQARLGKPTASSYHKILTPKTLKLSGQMDTYRNQLLAEMMLGCPIDEVGSQFMERGTALEQSAVGYYELQKDVEVQRVGFCLRDDERTGCSPDGLIGTDGGLEIKTPSALVHMGLMVDGISDEYKCQVQGNLYITGREWWDVLSFNPDMPSVIVRMERDETYIAKLHDALELFLLRLDEAVSKLVARGHLSPEFERELLVA